MKIIFKLSLLILTFLHSNCNRQHNQQSDSQSWVYDYLNKTLYYSSIYNSNILAIRGNTITSIPVSWYPEALVLNSKDNKLYCVNKYADSLSVIDLKTKQIEVMKPTGHHPSTVIWNDIHDKIYFGDYNGLTVIDGKTNNIIKNIKLENGVSSCLWNRKMDYIYTFSFHGLVVIDCRGDRIIDSIPFDDYTTNEAILNVKHNVIFFPLVKGKAIIVLDCKTNKIISRVKTTSIPYCLKYNQQLDILYCLNGGDSSIMEINWETSTIKDYIKTKGSPRRFTLNAGGDKIYCVEAKGISLIDCRKKQIIKEFDADNSFNNIITIPENDLIYAFSLSSSRILCINSRIDEVVDTIKIMPMPTVLLYASPNNTMYCGNALNKYLSVIEANSDKSISKIQTVLFPFPSIDGLTIETYYHQLLVLNPEKNRLYVSSPYDSSIVIINLSNNSIMKQIKLGTPISAIISNWKMNEVYCIGRDKSTLSIIDEKLNILKKSVLINGYAYFLVYNTQHNELYCACRQPKSRKHNIQYNIQVLDCNTMSSIATIPQTTTTAFMLYVESEDRIYAAEEYSEVINVIDCKSRKVIKQIDLKNEPTFPPRLKERYLVFNKKENKIYCTNMGSDNISVVDVTENVLINNIPVGGEPGVSIWNPNNNKLYCANRRSNTISVIDCNNDKIVKTINTGHIPYYLSLIEKDNKIFCANYGSASVSVINCDNDSVTKTISIP